MSKRPRLKPEQIVAKLREIEVKLSQGKEVKAACREAGTTDKSYYRWRREFGGMKVDQAKRLKQLELENARLKRLVGELHLEKAVLTDDQHMHNQGHVIPQFKTAPAFFFRSQYGRFCLHNSH